MSLFIYGGGLAAGWGTAYGFSGPPAFVDGYLLDRPLDLDQVDGLAAHSMAGSRMAWTSTSLFLLPVMKLTTGRDAMAGGI